MIMSDIEDHEERDIATINITGAYLHTGNGEYITK